MVLFDGEIPKGRLHKANGFSAFGARRKGGKKPAQFISHPTDLWVFKNALRGRFHPLKWGNTFPGARIPLWMINEPECARDRLFGSAVWTSSREQFLRKKKKKAGLTSSPEEP